MTVVEKPLQHLHHIVRSCELSLTQKRTWFNKMSYPFIRSFGYMFSTTWTGVITCFPSSRHQKWKAISCQSALMTKPWGGILESALMQELRWRCCPSRNQKKQTLLVARFFRSSPRTGHNGPSAASMSSVNIRGSKKRDWSLLEISLLKTERSNSRDLHSILVWRKKGQGKENEKQEWVGPPQNGRMWVTHPHGRE